MFSVKKRSLEFRECASQPKAHEQLADGRYVAVYLDAKGQRRRFTAEAVRDRSLCRNCNILETPEKALQDLTSKQHTAQVEQQRPIAQDGGGPSFSPWHGAALILLLAAAYFFAKMFNRRS